MNKCENSNITINYKPVTIVFASGGMLTKLITTAKKLLVKG